MVHSIIVLMFTALNMTKRLEFALRETSKSWSTGIHFFSMSYLLFLVDMNIFLILLLNLRNLDIYLGVM